MQRTLEGWRITTMHTRDIVLEHHFARFCCLNGHGDFRGVDVESARAALQTVVFITLGAFLRDLRCAVMFSFEVSITARSRQASDNQICVELI